jgi:molecular chaperone HtpG
MELSSVELTTTAEKKAAEAESLPAFSPIKLLHIKRSIAELLKQFGTSGIFEEYTRHDITHINSMLEIAGWLVPEASRTHMEPADWLLLVLSIYFHDLGLLVTKDEFASRENSAFPAFCNNILFAGDDGTDYRAKVDKLPVGTREKFLYQEFVRSKHATRIRQWISGEATAELGVASNLTAEINNLLRDIDPVFRRDLGLVCESHHLDDLNDTKKYKTRQPYGTSAGETANLQYCAVLLRTADLLHITKDRTPSITFRTLNPSDPVSQEAWAKQMAVRSVRPQLGRDKEGNITASAIQDTIEVHAFFQSPPGFFRLTSYLSYAEQQLRQSHSWIDVSRRTAAVQISFPWRHIDQSFIETAGFINEPFEFSLDQAKILDLLTGHTLYNETSVVIRELVQNSLDAVRLQCLISGTSPRQDGQVILIWDSKARVLTIEDNGTGMSQTVIEDHLLKVGSSRYQDPDFKKLHPDFFPISRFGIGVLSCFMVADSVEITTTTPEEEQARQLTLKSVHGRYLIRLLDKSSDEVKSLGTNGTRVRLELRASANFDNPVAVAKKWIVVPSCSVTLQVDKGKPINIGASSPSQALIDSLKAEGFSVETSDADQREGIVRVKEFILADLGLQLAVALQWSNTFQEWQFLELDPDEWEDDDTELEEDDDYITDEDLAEAENEKEEEEKDIGGPCIGICVEGVRVQFSSPGFVSKRIYALANTTGRLAPRTNVARSSFEETDEHQQLLTGIYALYMRHIDEEISALTKQRSFSITWAVQEARVLSSPFLRGRALTNSRLASDALADVPLLIAEESEARVALTRRQLQQHDRFWTVEGSFYDSAETLLREVPGPGSLRTLIGSLRTPSLNLPDELILCRDSLRVSADEAAFTNREPVRVKVDRTQRRLDVEWGKMVKPPKWVPVVPPSLRREELELETRHLLYEYQRRFEPFVTSYVAQSAIPVDGLQGEIAVKANGCLWFFSDSLLAGVLRKLSNGLITGKRTGRRIALLKVLRILDEFIKSGEKAEALRALSPIYDEYKTELSSSLSKKETVTAIQQVTPLVFDPHAWTRRGD